MAHLYPVSDHVLAIGLRGASDSMIWKRVAEDGVVLVTKDEDFQRFSILRGSPPIIWIRLGNCTTADVARLLRFRHAPSGSTNLVGRRNSRVVRVARGSFDVRELLSYRGRQRTIVGPVRSCITARTGKHGEVDT